MWEVLGIKPSIAMAGFVGGLLSLLTRPGLSPKSAILCLLGGVSCAVYFGPLVDIYFDLDQRTEHAVALFLGLIAINLIAWIINLDIGQLANKLIERLFKK
ncbi:MAG: hypothetical protein AAF542_17945 [Pseudomonadota bacterium]